MAVLADVRPRLGAVEKNAQTHSLEAAPDRLRLGLKGRAERRGRAARVVSGRRRARPEPRVLRLELVDAPPELPAPVTPVDAGRRCPRHVLGGQ